MIIHKTSYGLFYSNNDISEIEEDCKRSAGNAKKIYYHCRKDGIPC